MNNTQRKTLKTVISKLDELQGQLSSFIEEITNEAEAEREKFDNMSDGLQQSENGQLLHDTADTLEEIAGELETASETITEQASALQEAIG